MWLGLLVTHPVIMLHWRASDTGRDREAVGAVGHMMVGDICYSVVGVDL